MTVGRTPSSAASISKLALGLALCVFLGLSAALWRYVVDDTFISLRYARHLAEGAGLVYNIGERVEGYTNLLWTLLLAAGHLVPGNPVVWTKLLSIAAALLTAWVTTRLATASDLVPRGWALLPGALWLALPVVAMSAAEGLETMLFAALLTSSLVAALERRAIAVGLILAALTLTRPDGILLAPFLLAWVARERGLAAMLRSLGILALILGAVEIWRVAYYGEWLPNTFYAKSGGSLWLLIMGARSFLAFWAIAGAGVWLLAIPVIRRPAAMLLVAAALTRLAFHLWSGGPWMGEHRFLVPLLPPLIVVVTAGLLTLTRRPTVVGLVCAAFLLPGWYAAPRMLDAGRHYGAGVQRAYVPLGRHLDRSLPPDAVIACGDAGAIAYYSRRTAIDILGLNDHHIARVPGDFMVDKHDAGYVLSRRPDAIVLLATSPAGGDWLTPADAELAASPEFQATYERDSSWELLARYHLLVYRPRQ